MNRLTNQTIERQLKANRYLRIDEIQHIMKAVDSITERQQVKGAQQKGRTKEPPFQMFLTFLMKTKLDLPLIVEVIIFGVGFFVGKSV